MQGNHDSLSEIGRIDMSEFQILIEEAKDGVTKGFSRKYWRWITYNFGIILFKYMTTFKRGYHEYLSVWILYVGNNFIFCERQLWYEHMGPM